MWWPACAPRWTSGRPRASRERFCGGWGASWWHPPPQPAALCVRWPPLYAMTGTWQVSLCCRCLPGLAVQSEQGPIQLTMGMAAVPAGRACPRSRSQLVPHSREVAKLPQALICLCACNLVEAEKLLPLSRQVQQVKTPLSCPACRLTAALLCRRPGAGQMLLPSRQAPTSSPMSLLWKHLALTVSSPTPLCQDAPCHLMCRHPGGG